MSQAERPVLIIGGGIVGIMMSLCLKEYGIDSFVIERHSGTSIHPRARSMNARTVEIFRHLGVAERVQEAGASLSPSAGIYHTDKTLKELVESKPRRAPKQGFPLLKYFASLSPVQGIWVTQDVMEPVLADVAKEKGVDIRFLTECIDVEQDGEGVTATIRNRESGATSTIRGRYLLAADGAKSPIRARFNVKTNGDGDLGHLLNILFHADLASLVKNREFSLCKIERPEVTGLFAAINNADRWVFQLSYDPSKGEKPSDFTNERCKELLRIALGMPDIDIDIKSILPWEPAVRVAQNFRIGERVFLAGDAAHSMPPWAGQGATSGIGDAFNLSWKLAAVLRGHAGTELLDTYEVERLPVCTDAANASASGVDKYGFISLDLSLSVIRGWLRKLPLIAGFGYGYSSKAICSEDTSPLGGWTWRPWTLPSLLFALDGRPGRRAPHIWIDHDGKRISTLDLLGKRFVLLAGSNGAFWLDAAKGISKSLGIELAAHCLGANFEAAAGISPDGAILVRPDDFVAWRQRRKPSNYEAELEAALRQILARS